MNSMSSNTGRWWSRFWLRGLVLPATLPLALVVVEVGEPVTSTLLLLDVVEAAARGKLCETVALLEDCCWVAPGLLAPSVGWKWVVGAVGGGPTSSPTEKFWSLLAIVS